MAEKEYTVVAPDGKEITLIGPVGASQEEIIAQAQRLYKPTAQRQITATGPYLGGDRPAPIPQQPTPTALDYAKAVYEVPANLALGVVAPFVGAAKGIVQNIRQGTNERVDRPELAQEVANLVPPTSPVSQSILESVGKVLDTTKIAPVTGLPVSSSLSQASEVVAPMTRSIASKPVQKLAGALRKEPTVEPVTGEIKSTVAQRYKEAFTPTEKPTYATAEELAQKSTDLFKKAQDSGVELNPQYFSNYMKSIQKDLRQEGYDPRTMPKVAVALEEMQRTDLSKDLQELKTLRKFIQNAKKRNDLDEKRVGTILKGEFDDYVANIPESSIKGGSKEGLAAWKEARDTYSKLSKAEIFDDMLETAKLEKGKYSQAGIEQSLYNQLKNLAKNDKRMRMFTAEEQAAIKKAAEGTDLQNTLKFIGKFAPTSTVSSILPLLVTGASAPAGIIGTAAAIGSRAAAAQMRKNQIEQLANLMRGTVPAELQVQQKPVNPQLLKMLRMDQGE